MIDETESDYLVFAHQDIYCPDGGERTVLEISAWLDRHAPSWAVLCLIGVDKTGNIKGRSWSVGLNRAACGALAAPVPGQSIDELVIILKRKRGIRFDEHLPGVSHLRRGYCPDGVSREVHNMP